MADDREEGNGVEILQKLQRDINCLSDVSKTTRRRSIEKLRKEIGGHVSSPPLLHWLLDNGLLKPLLKLFSDSAEKCRELAIASVQESMEGVTDHAHFLPLIIPIIVARLGTPDITEPSEEIRLSLVSFLVKMLDMCGREFSPYLHDMITILRYTLIDPYPEVKKESCLCTIKLASSVPSVFHQESEILVKSLLHSLAHQHSKVRIATIKALGAAVQYGTATPINDCLPGLAQRLCDTNPSVRLTSVRIIGNWLLELPDRYSYHHKLIPLLLTGLTDEVDEIKETAHKLWIQIGDSYEKENENDLKDKLDFAQIKDPFPSLEFQRPSLGCRVFVYRNFSKILPAILRDLKDWTANSRIKSSQLLHSLLYHMEDSVTHHVQLVLDGLYKSSQDEEKSVVEWSCKSAQLIGYYVSPEIWCHLVLPAVRTSGGCPSKGEGSSVPVGPVQCTGCLMILSHLIVGASNDHLQPHLKDISVCLAEPDLTQSSHFPLLEQLLNCISQVIQASSSISLPPLSLNLFIVLLRLSSSFSSFSSLGPVQSAMFNLSERLSMNDIGSLYSSHALDIVTILKKDYKFWSISSSNCKLCLSFLSGEKILLALEDEAMTDVIRILAHCTDPEQEPELRLKFISVVIKCLTDASSGEPNHLLQSHAPSIIKNIIIPSCVWRAGRTAGAIRTAALSGVQALLHSRLLSPDQIQSLLSLLLPQVLSCLDDDNPSTRLVSCKVLGGLLQSAPQAHTVDELHQLYSHLLKRLDDSSDDIRRETSHCLVSYFNAFPAEYDTDLYKAHTETIYTALLVHLDDPSEIIQSAILDVLKSASRLNRSLLTEMVEKVKDKHRTINFCDQLLSHLSQTQ